MKNNVIQFPAPVSEFDAISENAMTDEQREAIREGIRQQYAAQQAKEDAHRGNAREISPETFAARLEYQARKQQPTQNAEGVHIGDIFYGSWGYEQTNVDFFQVVALKGKHTAVLREIKAEYIGGFSWQGYCRPRRDDFSGNEEYTVRTKMCDYFNPPRLQLNHPTVKGRSLDQIGDDGEVGYSSYY